LFAPEHYAAVFAPAVEAGRARAAAAGRPAGFEIAPMVPVMLDDDVDACRAAVKPFLALYVGGMGAAGKNFYYDLVCRYGFEDAAATIQGHYLQGRREAALAAVPDALVDAVALCGPKARIAEHLSKWQGGGATLLNLSCEDPAALRVMAELVL
jgi:alkanesulfonate monooxygenase SsuD/methylene tetrahydromethanopterin reductase-like flavin-dependent oxidoreductase (luciferase family)